MKYISGLNEFLVSLGWPSIFYGKCLNQVGNLAVFLTCIFLFFVLFCWLIAFVLRTSPFKNFYSFWNLPWSSFFFVLKFFRLRIMCFNIILSHISQQRLQDRRFDRITHMSNVVLNYIYIQMTKWSQISQYIKLCRKEVFLMKYNLQK